MAAFRRTCTRRGPVAAVAAWAAFAASSLHGDRAFFSIFGSATKSGEKIPPAEVVGAALRSPNGPNKQSTAWEVLDTTRLPSQTALVTGANSGRLSDLAVFSVRLWMRTVQVVQRAELLDCVSSVCTISFTS